MTPEQIQAALNDRANFRKLAQEFKARNDELLAKQPTAEELAKVADHLIATGVVDAAQKEAAVDVLKDPKKALDTVVNLASLVRDYAQGVGADGNPGQPIKTAAGAQALGAGEPQRAYDWTDDPQYQEMTAEIIKLAAHAATV